MKKNTALLLILFVSLINCTLDANNEEGLENYIESRAIELKSSSDLAPLIDAAGEANLVLLGEASHGTYEYYIWRDSISRRLIEEKGYNFIAVEGDWASLFELNKYVKNLPGAAENAEYVLWNLDRWPTWMWGNREIIGLAEWLREYNDGLPDEEKVGFYGMDVYDEWRSKKMVLELLEKHFEQLYNQVRIKYNCISPYKPDSWLYARSVAAGNPNCKDEFAGVVELLSESRDMLNVSDYDYFYLLQNAYVVKNAEKFYRKSVVSRDASSWNSRVTHMHETVERLLDYYGEGAKGIVWAHNTHIGDAQYTEMRNWGQVNIGQLSRSKHGANNVLLIGFGTYKGSVKAGSEWEGRMRRMVIPNAAPDSHEEILSKVSFDSYFLHFNQADRNHDELMAPRGNRAVGVVYNPRNDHQQNYVNTILPLRYDAFIFFQETNALNSLRP